MFSSHFIFGLGIGVSVLNICLWIPIITNMLKQYNGNDSVLKSLLLGFAIITMFGNIMPIWFDIYRLIHAVSPTNIFYAYVMNNYLIRTMQTIMFYVIYKFFINI